MISKEDIWDIVASAKGLTEKDLKNLASWAFKSYFSPEKNKEKRWYREEVTEETVLKEFIKPESPISPAYLVDLWKAIPILKKSLFSFGNNMMFDDDDDNYHLGSNRRTKAKKRFASFSDYKHQQSSLSDEAKASSGSLSPSDDKKIKKNRSFDYFVGDTIMQIIGGEIGGVTLTMTEKIFNSGVSKIRFLFNGKSFQNITPEDNTRVSNLIDSSVKSLSDEFAELLSNSEHDINVFLEKLSKSKLIDLGSRKNISNEEKEAWVILSEYAPETIKLILIEDFEGCNKSIFAMFQSAVSRRIYGNRKKDWQLDSNPLAAITDMKEAETVKIM